MHLFDKDSKLKKIFFEARGGGGGGWGEGGEGGYSDFLNKNPTL